MEVYLRIRRQKLSMYLNMKESSTVAELKKEIEAILQKPMADFRLLYKSEKALEDNKTMRASGLTAETADPQRPADLALVFKTESGDWEAVNITPFSKPKPLEEQQQDISAIQAQHSQPEEGPQPGPSGQ